MVLARQADRDADGEHQPQVGENRIAGCREHRNAQQIRLTESQQ